MIKPLPEGCDPVELYVKRVADRARYFRRKQGLRQKDLANRAGISLKSICDLESGKFPMTLRSLIRIAFALRVEAYKLLEPAQPNEHAPRYPRGAQPRVKRGEMTVSRRC